MTAPLDSLHDFYQPPPPSWRPQTIGWYLVFAIAAVLLLWFVIYLVRRWRANRYRRAALSDLACIEASQLSVLLKRTALSAWPREEVAFLTGPEWLNFLDDSAPQHLFANAPADRLEDLAFSTTPLSSEDESVLRAAADKWIRQHHPPSRRRGTNVSA